MDENILRESVELTEGFSITDDGEGFGLSIEKLDGENWTWCFGSFSEPPTFLIAALASQLISQVEVPGRIRVEANTGFTAIRNCEALKDGHTPMWVDIVAEYGPNRDENSIIACVEFLRGLK